jgi:glycosyltransferase involved in cell wall biosynthesis
MYRSDPLCTTAPTWRGLGQTSPVQLRLSSADASSAPAEPSPFRKAGHATCAKTYCAGDRSQELTLNKCLSVQWTILHMSCSIIIPTKDRPIGLLQAVKSAVAALPHGGEVVVVDDGCELPAADVLAPLMGQSLRVVSNPGPHGPSGARNYGVAQASYPIIFFLDDDDVLLPGYCLAILEKVATLPEAAGYGFSSALVKTVEGPSLFQGKAIESGVLDEETPLDERLTGLGTGFWIKRPVFLSVGGLDTALRVNEDTEFAVRLAAAGVRAYYHRDPGVLIFHDPVRDAKDRKSITQSADALGRAEGFEYILRKHERFLEGHRDFRRKFMLRAIKYRSRARTLEGWTEFCMSLRPGFENRLMWLHGWIWLQLSLGLRKWRG